MAKQTVYDIEYVDWINGLEDKTREEALTWIMDHVPFGCTMDVDYGYECSSGQLKFARLETDEEESTRETKAAEVERARLARYKLEVETNEARMERMKHEDTAVYAYLSLHKGNPKIGDLENLFRATLNLERDGKGPTATQALRECMARLENYAD